MGNKLTTPELIGAVVGTILGAALIAVFISCIIFINKKLIWKTNTRSKIIHSGGQVVGDKWVIDDTKVPSDDKGRRDEIFLPPPPTREGPPSPVPQLRPPRHFKQLQPLPRPVIAQPEAPQKTPPRLKRYKLRSWPRREPERPIIEHHHGGSIGQAGGTNYFIYGMPYPVPSTTPYQPPIPVHRGPPNHYNIPSLHPPPPPQAPPRRRRQPQDWSPSMPGIKETGAIVHVPRVRPPTDEWQLEEQEVIVGDFASEYGGLTINMDTLSINNDSSGDVVSM